jgi:hypothetical protein
MQPCIPVTVVVQAAEGGFQTAQTNGKSYRQAGHMGISPKGNFGNKQGPQSLFVGSPPAIQVSKAHAEAQAETTYLPSFACSALFSALVPLPKDATSEN